MVLEIICVESSLHKAEERHYYQAHFKGEEMGTKKWRD